MSSLDWYLPKMGLPKIRVSFVLGGPCSVHLPTLRALHKGPILVSGLWFRIFLN